MKRKLNLYLAITLVITLFSCSTETENKMGDWNDNIHLSPKTSVFNAAGDSVTIKTEGNSWWITDVSVDNSSYKAAKADLQSDGYSIKEDGFRVERRNKNTLFIKVEANTKNIKRTISVGLQSGDYFENVTVTQKSN